MYTLNLIILLVNYTSVKWKCNKKGKVNVTYCDRKLFPFSFQQPPHTAGALFSFSSSTQSLLDVGWAPGRGQCPPVHPLEPAPGSLGSQRSRFSLFPSPWEGLRGSHEVSLGPHNSSGQWAPDRERAGVILTFSAAAAAAANHEGPC